MADPAKIEWKFDPSFRNRLLFTIAQNELFVTRSFVAEDNPWSCTAKEVANWKKYRAAWMAIATGDKKHISWTGSSANLIGVQEPNPPPGWISIMKQVGEVPAVRCRVTDLDIVDPTLPADPSSQSPKISVEGEDWQVSSDFVVEGGYVNTCDYDMTAP